MKINITTRERCINGIECWAAELWIDGVCFFTTTHLGKEHAMKLAADVARGFLDAGHDVRTGSGDFIVVVS